MTTSAPTLTLRCNRVGRQRRHADLRRACNFAMAIGAFGILVSSLQATNARAQNKLPLQLVQTVLMPNVHGRMDHLGADVEGGRLFAAALGDTQNTVEVIDLKAGKQVFSIRGQSMPQGVLYSPRSQSLRRPASRSRRLRRRPVKVRHSYSAQKFP